MNNCKKLPNVWKSLLHQQPNCSKSVIAPKRNYTITYLQQKLNTPKCKLHQIHKCTKTKFHLIFYYYLWNPSKRIIFSEFIVQFFLELLSIYYAFPKAIFILILI